MGLHPLSLLVCIQLEDDSPVAEHEVPSVLTALLFPCRSFCMNVTVLVGHIWLWTGLFGMSSRIDPRMVRAKDPELTSGRQGRSESEPRP